MTTYREPDLQLKNEELRKENGELRHLHGELLKRCHKAEDQNRKEFNSKIIKFLTNHWIILFSLVMAGSYCATQQLFWFTGGFYTIAFCFGAIKLAVAVES